MKSIVASNGNQFVWDDGVGYGYLPPQINSENIYDIEYWQNYWKLRDTDIGKKLNQARIDLVKKYSTDDDIVIDVGIGNGHFVEQFGCYGYDVNPHAKKWLIYIGALLDPNQSTSDWITMWDVIEHIEVEHLQEMFNKNKKGVILSTPIYKNFEDCISSKHFKPNEHIHYFSVYGVLNFMSKFGYECVEMSTIESRIGRESIMSFVFVKKT